jgi:predicted class III extradiol MEMO1 family dioxygenase
MYLIIYNYYLLNDDKNQTGYSVDSFRRQISWDDADRVTKVVDTMSNTVIVSQLDWYNDAGQRVIKKEGTVETQYVNQFTSVRSDAVNAVTVTTNNIFVGNERICSSLAANNSTDTAEFEYFYHTDHLGSTGYMIV